MTYVETPLSPRPCASHRAKSANPAGSVPAKDSIIYSVHRAAFMYDLKIINEFTCCLHYFTGRFIGF